MRAINFGAGPATLPLEILTQVQEELLDWRGSGMSVMEISHRSTLFCDMLEDAEKDLRDLLSIPPSYHVLFLGFPSRFQFSMIPKSFLRTSADYLVTGFWSQLAHHEANKKMPVRQLNDASDLNKDADYFYYTPNETLSGIAYAGVPKVGDVPLVADMTSCLLSMPLNVSEYDLIFAGTQKNIAPAGVTLVIISDAFLHKATPQIETLCDYRTHVQYKSNYATPPTFTLYMAGLMFKWLHSQGGLISIHDNNLKKANLLYDFIDGSDFYCSKVPKVQRSLSNVVFTLRDDALTDPFLQAATHENLVGLKGHRKVGGCRASLYNAMPLECVETLIAFMVDFALRNEGA